MNAAVILAAGQGTRMKSKLPKVLHKVAGQTMLGHILETLDETLVEQKILVLGHQGEIIQKQLPPGIDLAFQKTQLGTGHAVMQAGEIIAQQAENVLVVCGDTPLLRGATLQQLLEQHISQKAAVTILTARVEDATGYGRIVREQNRVRAIVEEKEATALEKEIKEINTGAYCFQKNFLLDALGQLTTDNQQGEYYLTDLVQLAVAGRKNVEAYLLGDHLEALGVNNRLQLAQADQELRRRKLEELMLAGVSIINPATTVIDYQVNIGLDTIIYPGCVLEGKTSIGENCIIGPDTRIIDSQIGQDVNIENSVLKESIVGNQTRIGPFAYLRPGSVLGKNIRVGDFVEIKNSIVGDDSSIPHLSYVGDADVGQKVNIACGTITCNYDGQKKYRTTIEDEAFVGSNTNLIAPVTVGKGAYIAAGSTITKDVPSGALGIARGRQQNILHWKEKNK